MIDALFDTLLPICHVTRENHVFNYIYIYVLDIHIFILQQQQQQQLSSMATPQSIS